MKRLLLAALLGLLAVSPGAAQTLTSAIVVTSCGTLGTTYVAGSAFPVVQDLTGHLCTNATSGATFNQGTPNTAANAWPVLVALGGTAVSGTNPLPTNITQMAGTALGTPVAYGSTPTGNALPVNAYVTNGSNDPCVNAKSSTSVSITASTQIITGTAAKKTYICSLDLIGTTAGSVALVEGTGTTCATNIYGLAGGTTAATGWPFGATSGLVKGTGVGTVYFGSGDTNATAANVCLLISGTGQTSGSIQYVQQ